MKMMIRPWPLEARLKRWTGNVTIGFGAVAVFLMAMAGVAALVVVFGAAARLLIGWCQYYPR
jgi:hypothetical protein